METRAEVDDARLCEPQTAVEQGHGQDARPDPGETKCSQQPRIRLGSL